MSGPFTLSAMAVASCLGMGKAATAQALFAGTRRGLVPRDDLLPGRRVHVGALPQELPALPSALSRHESRNNRLLWALLQEIADPVQAAVSAYGRDRVAVILGTSTSGIAEGEAALAYRLDRGEWPPGFHYSQQETGSPAAFVSAALGLGGPAYVVATACSSSAKVFASARRLIRLGLVDAAIVGGADTLCRLTTGGFASLEAMSAAPCNPFSLNRCGVTIGEGGALFLMTRGPGGISLRGVGESSDAHHVSAPDPDGRGALAAMRLALQDAALSSHDIAYVNLHGTATPLNDSMESKAVNELFGAAVPCSSTKAMTGHTLGAAGAVEAAFLWLTLSPCWNPQGMLPPHLWDGVADPALPLLALAGTDSRVAPSGSVSMLSNSFAFGGSNCALVLARGEAP
jgi:3-oxoacyl-(acyl-carrier-protein) synthase